MSSNKVHELGRSGDRHIPEPRVGRIVELAKKGPVVDFPGNPGGPVLARTTIGLNIGALEEALERSYGVLLMFERGMPSLPILMGILAADPLAEASLRRTEPLTAEIDGRRLELEAADELVLRCGKASIRLRRNGRVVIRGVDIETRASARQRIKGGVVQIN